MQMPETSAPFQKPVRNMALIFTGHMIDLPDRTTPRFPPRLEAQAAAVIRNQIDVFKRNSHSSIIGIAGGARGGDILFHEICSASGVPTILVLPFNREAFLDRSVRGVETGHWEERFQSLWHHLGSDACIVLELEDAPDPFGACNGEMLAIAQKLGKTVELLALWDGKNAGKPGGTSRFVDTVLRTGGNVTRIDPATLAG